MFTKRQSGEPDVYWVLCPSGNCWQFPIHDPDAASFELTVQPNPLTDASVAIIHQHLSGNLNLRIVDIMGRTMTVLNSGWLAEGEHHLGRWKFVLPPLLLFLSFMMFSRFEYPSFKAINWKTQKSIPRFLVISILLILTAMFYQWMPAVLFLSYLLYGFLRPWLSREWRREIEEEIGEEGSDEPTEQIS